MWYVMQVNVVVCTTDQMVVTSHLKAMLMHMSLARRYY